MQKCNKCLRGSKISITGIEKNTLKMDIGGAVIYISPHANGSIDVSLNAESLLDGDYAYSTWSGEQWIISAIEG